MAKKKKEVTDEELIETPIDSENETSDELYEIIHSLKSRNLELEAEKAELYVKYKNLKDSYDNKEPEVIEKIVEVPVEKIVERIIEVPVEKVVEKIVEVSKINTDKPYKYKLGDMVYYPEVYQRMDFEIRERQGWAMNGQPLYRILNHVREIEMNFIPENKLKLL